MSGTISYWKNYQTGGDYKKVSYTGLGVSPANLLEDKPKVNNFIITNNRKPERFSFQAQSATTTQKPSMDRNPRAFKQQKGIQGLQFKFTKDKSPEQHSRSFPKKLEDYKQTKTKTSVTPRPIFGNFRSKNSQLVSFQKSQQIVRQARPVTQNSYQASKLFDVPSTPKLQYLRGQNNVHIKSPTDFDTAHRTESSQPQYLNRTHIVSDLARQLNLKQAKISELQQKLSLSKNTLNTIQTQYARQLKQKERQKAQINQTRSRVQNQLKLLKCQNTQLVNKLNEKEKLIQLSNIKEQELVQKINELVKRNNTLEQSLQKAYTNIQQQTSDSILIGQIRSELLQKGRRILELEKYNQSILLELEKSKQSVSASASTPMFAMPDDNNNFSVFEEAFKTYVEGTDKYKAKIQEKEKEIEAIKQTFGAIRVENQRLKNQLKIEELRRLTEIKANDTILDVKRTSLMNQLRDVRHQLSLSKEKTRSLSNEIKSKDQFIMRNIKQVK